MKTLARLFVLLFFYFGTMMGQEKDSTFKKFWNGQHLESKMLYFDTLSLYPASDIVFTIDILNNVKVPAGWEKIIVIKNGQVWSCDSSRQYREVSQPQRFLRKKRQ